MRYTNESEHTSGLHGSQVLGHLAHSLQWVGGISYSVNNRRNSISTSEYSTDITRSTLMIAVRVVGMIEYLIPRCAWIYLPKTN
jgi:hypothetical protein